MLKKGNAMLALIIYVLLITHTVEEGLLLCGLIRYSASFKSVGCGLMGIFSLHALLSVFLLFFNQGSSGRFYPSQNKQTAVQRLSAVLLLILIHFHCTDYQNYQDPAAITFVPEALFVIVTTMHASASAEHAYITLGVSVKGVTIITRCLLFASAVLGMAGLVRFFLL